MTEDALSICKEGINAVNPSMAVKRHISILGGILRIDNKEYNVNDYESILLVAFSKASSAMAVACIETIRGDNNNGWNQLPLEGVVILKDNHSTKEESDLLSDITIQYASHPVPDKGSAKGGCKIFNLIKKNASPKTLVLVYISGSGSSLFCEPQFPLTLEDLRDTNTALLGSGLSIEDMNVIRKRLETGKGGLLAKAAYYSRLLDGSIDATICHASH